MESPKFNIQTHLEVCNTKLRSGGAVELLLNWRAITGLGGRAIVDLKGAFWLSITRSETRIVVDIGTCNSVFNANTVLKCTSHYDSVPIVAERSGDAEVRV